MASMVDTTRVTTADQLLALRDDGCRYELVRGELRTMSPAGQAHGRIAARLLVRLGSFVDAAQLGRTYVAETGFWIERQPDTVRAPDVAFVATGRVPAGDDAAGFFEGAPDLAAEVVSPGDPFSDVEEKALAWLAAGSRMVLVVDPRRRTVTVYRAADDVRVLGAGDAIDGADVVPGWTLELADLFAA